MWELRAACTWHHLPVDSSAIWGRAYEDAFSAYEELNDSFCRLFSILLLELCGKMLERKQVQNVFTIFRNDESISLGIAQGRGSSDHEEVCSFGLPKTGETESPQHHLRVSSPVNFQRVSAAPKGLI